MIWKLSLVSLVVGLGALVFVLSEEVPAPTKAIHKTIDSNQFIKE